MTRKPILVSGIQPSGRLHIGNYLGALKNFVDLQNSGKYSCHFFLADLHSLTEPVSPAEQQKRIMELTADFLAAGLDPKKSVIYQHSQIPAHSELAWILTTITPEGDLRRMTQYKDKTARGEETNAGLLFYPTLMAADILLYDAKFVPVGNDQDQHLELTRTLARKFNKKFGRVFIEPQGLHTATPRVMSLKDPAKKMSKSQPETCLFLDDSPAEIEKKIKTATTDSGSEVRYDAKEKPGISNLLDIYCGVTGKTMPQAVKEFRGKQYGEFKQAVAGTLVKHLKPFRERKGKLKDQSSKLKTVLVNGSARASKIANAKIAEIKRKVGLAL